MIDRDFENKSEKHLASFRPQIFFLNIFSVFLAFVKKNL